MIMFFLVINHITNKPYKYGIVGLGIKDVMYDSI